MAAPVIGERSTVTLQYRLALEGGVVFEAPDAPLTITLGRAMLPLPIERALVGKCVGDVVSVKLAPNEAYGARNPKLVLTLPRTHFAAAEPLSVGKRVETKEVTARPTAGLVVSLSASEVQVDFNARLAGKPVVAVVKVLSVGQPTP